MMKKSLLYLLMAVFALNFISCKEDNDAMIPAKDLNTTFGASPDATLILNYSNNPVIGKQVTFNTKDNKTATLTLLDVIPGQSETVINNIQLIESGNEYTFNGSSAMTKATAANGSIAYSGSVKKGELNLKLNVTMPDPKGWAKTYQLGDYATGTMLLGETSLPIVTAGPLFSEWKGIEDETAELYSGLLRGVGALLLPQVIKNISLETDGNIQAEYATGSPIQMDQEMIMGMTYGIVPTAEQINALIPTSGWQSSPKNLAYWFEKEGQLYIKLNISAIIAQGMNSNGISEGSEMLSSIISKLLTGDAASIKSLLKDFLNIDFSKVSDETFTTLLSWVNNGIPMNIKTQNGHTYIYLDKDALAPLLKSYPTGETDIFGDPEMRMDIVEIWNALVAAEILPKEAESAGFLVAVIGAYYNMSTEFNLGLDLK